MFVESEAPFVIVNSRLAAAKFEMAVVLCSELFLDGPYTGEWKF